MFLWVLFLHNYIIPQKGCFLSFSGCSLFFYSATVFEIYCRYDFFDKPTGRRIACPYQIIRQNRGHFVSEILFIVRSLLNVTALYMNIACWYSERSMSLPRSTLM